MSDWKRKELDDYAADLAGLRDKASCVDAFITTLELLRESERNHQAITDLCDGLEKRIAHMQEYGPDEGSVAHRNWQRDIETIDRLRSLVHELQIENALLRANQGSLPGVG